MYNDQYPRMRFVLVVVDLNVYSMLQYDEGRVSNGERGSPFSLDRTGCLQAHSLRHSPRTSKYWCSEYYYFYCLYVQIGSSILQ